MGGSGILEVAGVVEVEEERTAVIRVVSQRGWWRREVWATAAGAARERVEEEVHREAATA